MEADRRFPSTLAGPRPGVEQFRSLRSRIYQARYEAPVKTILVSSGMPSEGKSFVAANLAMSLARNSENQHPAHRRRSAPSHAAQLLGAHHVPGLAEYLSGNVELNAILQRDLSSESDEVAGQRGILEPHSHPSGKCGDNSSELVSITASKSWW